MVLETKYDITYNLEINSNRRLITIAVVAVARGSDRVYIGYRG